jgi:hypothetical protein
MSAGRRGLAEQIAEARWMLQRATTPDLIRIGESVPPLAYWSRLLHDLIRRELMSREFDVVLLSQSAVVSGSGIG